MNILCVCDNGFEDQLTKGKKYEVVSTGANGFEIENDNGEERYYGATKFKYVRNDG